ncbi:hypothetical protein AtEden1_Chr4g0319941 [Arabidopsis thaliana]
MYIAHIFRVSVARLQFFNGPTTKNWAEPYQSIETSDTQSHITWQALIGRSFIFVERRKKKNSFCFSQKNSLSWGIFRFLLILPINFLLFRFLLNLFPFLENPSQIIIHGFL